MSISILGGIATRVGLRPADTRMTGRRARVWTHIASELWPPERGVAELRWGAVTLGIMALLGFGATLMDPAGSDFMRLLVLSVPMAILMTIAAWGPVASRLGRTRGIRLVIGPAVVIAAVMGAGLADIETLAIPPAATVIILAMAYAAITPGFPLAATIMAVASGAVLIAHGQTSHGIDMGDDLTDEFVVGSIVTLIASAGMAGVLRVATKAEARATKLSARRRERLDALETLNRIVARFDGSQPVPSVIQSVVDDLAREFEITLVAMYLPFGHDQLTMVGVAGYPTPFHEIEIGVGIIGRAAGTRQMQFVPDVLVDPDYRAARDDVRSEVAAPIVHGEELLGVVNFEGTLERPIGPAQVALAEMVVHALSAALRSARLDDERRDRLHAMERVLAVSRSLVADLDRTRIVTSIVEAAAELLNADMVALISRRHDGTYRAEAGAGFPADAIGLEIPVGHGLPGRCMAERKGLVGTLDGSTWPPAVLVARPGGDIPHAGLALPIVIAGEVAAVLLVSRVGVERSFSELEIVIGDLLTAQVAIALQNAELHARVTESAVRDPLTGLLNRRYFDEAVETAYAAAGRAGTDLSLIVFDLDRFSAVNNEYGHAVGDAVLRRVAGAMTGTVRTSDIVARYGGEEFVIIAPGSTQEDAVRLAERIRASVAREASRPIDGTVIPLTISAGVASRLGDEADGRALFRAADSALLAAKRAGRDRVFSV